MFLGSHADDLKKFKCDPREVLALVNILPSLWAETKKFFEAIFSQISVYKYGYDEKSFQMNRLGYPQSLNPLFYGLKKDFMPFPAFYLAFPPLRYVPVDFQLP